MLQAGALIEHRYEVVRLIGSGAMASVYEVRHTTLHSRHAIKVLDAALAQDPDLRNRFLAEGRIQAQLKHPNIVTVSDIVTDPVPGLVMEYIDGRALDEHLHASGPAPSPEMALLLFLPIVEAVGAAHGAGVIHRDLKPENILIELDGRGRPRPKVADFGIARVLDDTSIIGNKRRTEAGLRMGTVPYMSPEQIRGEEVTPRSDVFSLGAILYEILTGELAFAAPSEFDTMRNIVEGNLPPRVVGELHPGLAACIRKALAVDPAERFATCGEFAAALEAGVQGDAPLPERPTRSAAVTRLPEPATPPPPPAARPAARPTHPPDVYLDPDLIPPTPNAMPVVALLVNVVLTGVGQMMNGQVAKGLVILVLHWTLPFLTCGASFPITLIIACIDAYLIGQKLQQDQAVRRWEWF